MPSGEDTCGQAQTLPPALPVELLLAHSKRGGPHALNESNS